jgi:polyisoprenoid-binding protein YceI
MVIFNVVSEVANNLLVISLEDYFMAWEFDPSHSRFGFSVRHMVISTVRGQFDKVSGLLNINEDDLADSWVEAQAEVASINTHDPNRDGHLRSPDFFDAEKYPLITFKSTKIERDGSDHKVTGDLTMHGVTKPVVFELEYSGKIKDPYGLDRAGFSVKGKISRKEWGLTWHPTLETGGAVVSDEVKIDLEFEAINKVATSTQA